MEIKIKHVARHIFSLRDQKIKVFSQTEGSLKQHGVGIMDNLSHLNRSKELRWYFPGGIYEQVSCLRAQIPLMYRGDYKISVYVKSAETMSSLTERIDKMKEGRGMPKI